MKKPVKLKTLPFGFAMLYVKLISRFGVDRVNKAFNKKFKKPAIYKIQVEGIIPKNGATIKNGIRVINKVDFTGVSLIKENKRS